MSTRQPFRLFADFTGADPRFRKAPRCNECGTPLDEVPFYACEEHADWGRRDFDEDGRAPELAMDEVPFAPPEVHLPAERLTAEALGFVDRANVPVGAMRRSIHRSHRGEGRNFVD